MKKNGNKLCAFTLAEVLITLAIIGVVAALTIPTLVRNYTEKQTVVQLKKVYSQLNSAFQMATVNNGSPDTWDWGDAISGANADKVMQKYFVPYLKIIKNCANTNNECFYNGEYKSVNPSVVMYIITPNYRNYSRIVLADGSSVWFYTYGNACSETRGTSKALKKVCGSVGVDLNGVKPPNRFGVDTFYFWITKYGIIPMGTKDDTYHPLENDCNITKSGQNNGYACSAWVLAKENLDYLKGDVSAQWN